MCRMFIHRVFSCPCLVAVASRTGSCRQWDGRSGVCSYSKSHTITLRSWDLFCGAERARGCVRWECRGTCAQRKAVAAEGRSSALGFNSSVLLPSSLTCQKSKGVCWGVFSFFICVLEREQGKPSWPFKLREKRSRLNYQKSTLIDLRP